jgi:hypothetical protein
MKDLNKLLVTYFWLDNKCNISHEFTIATHRRTMMYLRAVITDIIRTECIDDAAEDKAAGEVEEQPAPQTRAPLPLRDHEALHEARIRSVVYSHS